MSRSGKLTEEDRLAIGAYRIAVNIASAIPANLEVSVAGSPRPLLELSGLDQQWRTTLKRAVTILGDDHPSMMRIRSAGLLLCQGVFISIDDHLWYMPLDMDAANPAGAPLLPIEVGQTLLLGKLKIRRLPSAAHEPMENPKPIADALADHSVRLGMPGNEVPEGAYASEFTSGVTKRMLRLGRRKQWKRRVLGGLLTCMLVALAIVVILEVFKAVQGDLPSEIPFLN